MSGNKLSIILSGNNFKYEIESVTKLFIPAERFDFTHTESDTDFLDEYILCKSDNADLKVIIKYAGQYKELSGSAEIYQHREHELCRLLYHGLKSITGINPPWGLITGIRPVKMVTGMLKVPFDEDKIKSFLTNEYEVSDKKLRLAFDTAKNQIPILDKIDAGAVSLYISIPFCPTRCSYCSFVSHSIESAFKLIPEYIECLCREIRIIADMIKENNIRVDTIYFGGGTPTSISAKQIEAVMKTISENFDLNNIREYNYEAGRADTITEEKLRVIKAYGADRISINPQTFNDEILKKIGRLHTGADTIRAYEMARKTGFSNINMDLIAGLPEETPESFKKSLDTAISLNPESITVHTLTLKRSGSLYSNGKEYLKNKSDISQMVDYSAEKLMSCGYNPYYLYRQKNTVDNLENVGYAKKGFESFYNIYIMDETQTIIGAGSSASTKLVYNNGKIERIRNYKFPYEYISRFDELMKKKEEVAECLKKISSSEQ